MPKNKSSVKSTTSQRRPDPMYDAVAHLIKLSGAGRGESGTENFYYMLKDVLEELDGTIEESHADGLCYDMCAAISDELTKRANHNAKNN